MSKRIIQKTAKGFKVDRDPIELEKLEKTKGGTQNARIEAKLDLILEKLGISLS